MINTKELFEDFLALGYDIDTAHMFAKQEFTRRQRAQAEARREYRRRVLDAPIGS